MAKRVDLRLAKAVREGRAVIMADGRFYCGMLDPEFGLPAIFSPENIRAALKPYRKRKAKRG